MLKSPLHAAALLLVVVCSEEMVKSACIPAFKLMASLRDGIITQSRVKDCDLSPL